ncbi:MAG: RnfABCDGE type electron transport complex subunit D [Candidatus Levybacteria bacterium]|nr:RnfABCDGE type electron transport complex subunit D [Candidatus Levybacteria bacterium]
MPSFLKLPKNQLIFFLSFLLIAASPRLGIFPAITVFLLCVGFCLAADIFFTYLRRRMLFFPRSALITGLILTLIIDPQATWYQIIVIAAAAILIKNFVRPFGKHIFNPAASGLFTGWVAFGLYPSWWAPSAFTLSSFFAIPNLLILIPILLIGYVSLYGYRRYVSAATYGAVYFFLLFFTNLSTNLSTALGTILSFGTFFYAFLMLVEPMTSPVKKIRQALYGAFVAGCTIVLVYLQKTTGMTLFDVSLIALLLGNLLFFRFR